MITLEFKKKEDTYSCITEKETLIKITKWKDKEWSWDISLASDKPYEPDSWLRKVPWKDRTITGEIYIPTPPFNYSSYESAIDGACNALEQVYNRRINWTIS